MASKIKVDQIEGSTGSTITIPTGQTFTVTDGIPVASGGTGLASFTAGDILYATGATTLTKLTKGTAEQVLAMNAGATAPDWGSVDLTVLPTISVAKGGTNISSFAAGDILYATGATTLTKLVKGSAADVLTMNAGATAPEWAAAAGGGKIGQVVQSVKTDTWTSSTGTTWEDVTDMTVTTGSLATTSSTVLVILQAAVFSQDYSAWRIVDGAGSLITNFVGDTDGSRTRATSGNMYTINDYYFYSCSSMLIDSPAATSAQTYKMQSWQASASNHGINRGKTDGNDWNNIRSVSTITAMEILA